MSIDTVFLRLPLEQMDSFVGLASLRDVVAWRAVVERPRVEHERVWGPVLHEVARAAGCIRAAASVVIKPHIAPHVVNAALQCVPAEVLPRVDDTPQSLAARLGTSSFLDDAHVLNGGNGKRGANGSKRRRLNASCLPAPRRRSWSVVVVAEREDEDGERVVSLFNYSAYGRPAGDVRSAPMPLPVFALGEQLWLAAMPYLSDACKRNPPTHCQLLLYYALFGSAMGRHRDNYTVRHLKAMLEGGSASGSTHADMENSQRIGSEVLLYTEGSTPMEFARRGKNGACFFEKCDSQYEAFGGVLERVDLTGNSQKHRGNRQLISPKVKKNSGRRKFSGLSRLFSIFSFFTTKNGITVPLFSRLGVPRLFS